MYGRSTSNQRIEAWWGLLRKACADWWINLFKDLNRETGLYVDDNVIHRECLKFCFMDVIQNELNRVAQNWNVDRLLTLSRHQDGLTSFVLFRITRHSRLHNSGKWG